MYSIEEYYSDIERLAAHGICVRIVGKSTLLRDIHVLEVGDMRYGTILIQGGMHAREYVTSPLIIRMLEHYHGRARVVALPSVNVDGMALVLHGLDSVEDSAQREYLYRVNGMSNDFGQWKANARAVDLNVNFDAGWGKGDKNITYPAPANYIGQKPLSEVETQILAGETLYYHPDITLSYHTKGEVIFEGYEALRPSHDMSTMIAEYLGYPLMESKGSYGGYKDWFVKSTGRIGLTIECGSDSLTHPIGIEHLDEIFERHDGLLDMLSDMVGTIRR